MEIITYRYKQHVGPSDDYNIGYRDISELQRWQKKDPLINDKLLIDKFKPKIDSEILEAIDFAEKSPYPNEEDLYTNVI